MPPGTKKRVSTAEDYDSDGGFVANDEDGDDRPKAKKSKTGKSSAPAKLAGSKDIREGKGIVGGGSVGANGEEFWELSDKRRVAISEYGGKKMINIREYYEKDGESLPGKKGISLPLAQFSTLITLLPHIESVLAEKGQSIPRPDYGDHTAAEGGGDAEDEEEEEEWQGEKGATKNGERGKKNFEETSEEEG